MKNWYDLIVVGAGPAGSWTAKYAAENGASVLMLEKDREVGLPVRCAEGVAEKSLKDLVDVRESWIAQVITGGRLISPNGTEITAFPDERGYILHRKVFDADLAKMAAEAGAEVVTKAYVKSLIQEDGRIAGVQVEHLGKSYDIHCKIVIGADGVESRVGRWAGLKVHIPPSEMESCAQMTLANIDIHASDVYFFFGDAVAPGGYLWIFPKGERTANVGLGISGIYSKKKKAIDYLREFVDRKFPDASILTLVAGGVPTCPQPKEIVADGVILVGDAARQTNPISGGGIINAMIAGKIAGEVAAKAIKKGDVSAKQLQPYAKQFYKAEGKVNDLSYKLKKVIYSFSDEKLDRIAEKLSTMDPKKITPYQLFKTALWENPKLLVDAAAIFLRG